MGEGEKMASGASAARAKIIGYKSALYSAVLFIIGVMQVTFFSKINVLSATPDLLLGAVLTLAVYEEHKVSAVAGIVAGFIYCALGGFSYPLYIFFSFACGYVFHTISEHAFGKNYLSYLALACFAFGVKGLYNVVDVSLSAHSFNVFNTIVKVVIPEFISSMIFCSISYFVFLGLTRIFNKKSKTRKDYI